MSKLPLREGDEFIRQVKEEHMAPLTKAEWKKRQRRRKYIAWALTVGLLLTFIVLLTVGVVSLIRNVFFREAMGTWEEAGGVPIQASLLTPNEYSRSQQELKQVNGVVIHCVGSPGVTAISNRNHFEQMKLQKKSAASMHFVVGLDGEIIQCIPVNETAYASAERNADTIAIEYCHNDVAGLPEAKTYDSLVKLTAKICKEYKLNAGDIMRHYDATGVNCPVYYVENGVDWAKFKEDVMALVEAGK